MKKAILILSLLLITTTMFAQKDVTKFMGIAVDGTKAEMVEKLKAKGFTESTYNKDILNGTFYGSKVNLFIKTNQDKVYKITVIDEELANESSVKSRFNNLCRLFMKHKSYQVMLPIPYEKYLIPDGESITKEMKDNEKVYEALFFQTPARTINKKIETEMKEALTAKFTLQEINDRTDAVKEEILNKHFDKLYEIYSKKAVWFNINECMGKYSISASFENGYNLPADK